MRALWQANRVACPIVCLAALVAALPMRGRFAGISAPTYSASSTKSTIPCLPPPLIPNAYHTVGDHRFTLQPSVGFSGTYELVFIRQEGEQGQVRVEIEVTLEPAP